MMDRRMIPKEGDIFHIIIVDEYKFELRYGYYEETDRLNDEPVPIYPNLKKYPLYSKDGFPLVTAIQIPCEYYYPSEGYESEDCCSSCIYYPNMKDEIAICQCQNLRLAPCSKIITIRGGEDRK